MDEQAEQRAMARTRRLTLWSALAMPPFFVDDLLSGSPNAPQLIGIKLVWGISLVATSLALSRVGPQIQRALVSVSAVGAVIGLSAIVHFHGGHQTPYFAWLFAVPFCTVAMVQGDVRSSVMAAVATVVGALALLLDGGVRGGMLTQWMLCFATSGALAVYASVHLRGREREERMHAHERLDALAGLAESEKRMAHAEKMATIGTLAGGVAHEINNPLAAVSSNLDFLESEVTNPTAPLEELTLVVLESQVAIRRIKGIVGDLTAYSREDVERETAVDLKTVVDEAERLAAERTGHQIGIQSELPSGLPQVLGNPRHLAQVFLNLLINAADAIGETARTDGQIWIRASKTPGAVTIDVDDNGPGLSSGVMKSLFVPFFTTRAPKRTGLGLATSREYLRRAGGDLTAATRPEGGARFTIALRAAIPSETASSAAAASGER